MTERHVPGGPSPDVRPSAFCPKCGDIYGFTAASPRHVPEATDKWGTQFTAEHLEWPCRSCGFVKWTYPMDLGS